MAVRIYNGAVPAGAPVQTLSAPRIGNSWSAQAAALAPGQYTAQATQANTQADGVSAPTTFTVPPGAAAGGERRAGAEQPAGSGDRDNDGIPDNQDTSDGSLPPVPGKTFDARVVSGNVYIKYPAGHRAAAAVTPPKGFVPLKGAANVPMGAQLDTRRGRVAVTSAPTRAGVTPQTADFYDGIFAVKQATAEDEAKEAEALITDLVLKGEPPRSECAPIKGASAAARARRRSAARSRSWAGCGATARASSARRQVQLGHRSRHDLVDPGSLRWDVDDGEARDGERSGLQAPQDGLGQGRAQLPRARGARRQQGQGRAK